MMCGYGRLMLGQETTSDIAPRLIRFGIAVLVLQLLYWAVIVPVAKYNVLPQEMRIVDFDVAPLNDPGARENLDWQSVTASWTGCCEHKHYLIRHSFELEAAPKSDFGIWPVVAADNFHVYMNGIPVRAHGELYPRSSFHGMKRELTRVPKELLRVGTNEITIVTARGDVPYTDLHPSYLGDFNELHAGTRWRFLTWEYRQMFAGIAGVVAIVALAFLFQTRNRAFAWWLFALSTAWCLRNSYYSWFDFPWSPSARILYFFAITNGLYVAWLGFAHAWTGVRSRVWNIALAFSVFVGVFITALTGIVMSTDFTSGYDLGSHLSNWFSVVVMGLTAVRIMQHLLGEQDERYWEVAAFLLCLTAIVADLYNEILFQENSGHITRAPPLFLASLIIAMTARNVRLYESMQTFNAALEDELRERENEIKSNYEELAQVQKREVLLEERQRILRDMHDGIGGQLLSLIAGLKRNHENTEVVSVLEDTLADLRLLIDSLDDIAGNLATALGIFRSRVEPRLKDAGFELDWRTRDLPMDVELPPKTVLGIYRILQEAIANVVKHTRPNRISVIATAYDDLGNERCVVEVIDQGGNPTRKDNAADSENGRGIASMRARAMQIGGKCEVEACDSGFRVRLIIPLTQSIPTNSGGVSA